MSTETMNANQLRQAVREACRARNLPTVWTISATVAQCRDFLASGAMPGAAPIPATPAIAAATTICAMPATADFSLGAIGRAMAAPEPMPAQAHSSGVQSEVEPSEVETVKRLLDLIRGSAKPAGVSEETEAKLAEVQASVSHLGDCLTDVAASIPKAVSDAIRTELDTITKAGGPLGSRAPLAIAAGSAPGSILATLAPFYGPGASGADIVLLTSPPSFGKSFAVRQLAASYDHYLEHGCSPDNDEIYTLLGTVSPKQDGTFAMVDGVLIQAMRLAASGKSVLFFLDEIFRLNGKAEDWLLTFLAPGTIDGVLSYSLRSRKMLPDGSDAYEIVTCPVERLHIVAAGNLSGRVPTDAFWSRFEVRRIDFTIAGAEEIAFGMLTSYGISDARTASVTAAKAISLSRDGKKAGTLGKSLDFRNLIRACRQAPTTAWADVRAVFAGSVHNTCCLWDSDSGDSNGLSAAECVRIADGIRTDFV